MRLYWEGHCATQDIWPLVSSVTLKGLSWGHADNHKPLSKIAAAGQTAQRGEPLLFWQTTHWSPQPSQVEGSLNVNVSDGHISHALFVVFVK